MPLPIANGELPLWEVVVTKMNAGVTRFGPGSYHIYGGEYHPHFGLPIPGDN